MARLISAVVLMLLPVAVKAATCANYDGTNESYCVSMNDGGCACVWTANTSACSQGTVCDGVGITSVGDENVTNTTTTASNGASMVSSSQWTAPGLRALAC
ncbi:DNAH7, partial [Symbiodinium necroappetens]